MKIQSSIGSWFKKNFTREQWKMVKIMDVPIKTSCYPPEDGTVYFYLYESDRGNRKYETSTNIHRLNLTSTGLSRLVSYNTIVYPWFKGKYFPDIPAYKDMDSEDLIAKLSE